MSVLKRYHRILIVNETIETYLESDSDSDSNELLIDESIKDVPSIPESSNSMLNTLPPVSEKDKNITCEKVDELRKNSVAEWNIEKTKNAEKSPIEEYFAPRNPWRPQRSEVSDSKLFITETCEIVEEDCSIIDLTTTDILDSKQLDENINDRQSVLISQIDQRFRKIAPKEWPINTKAVDDEIWRINPRKIPVKKKKRKVIIKFERKRIIPKKNKKIRQRFQPNATTDVENLDMVIDDCNSTGQIEITPEICVKDTKEEDVNLQFEEGVSLIQCAYCNYKHPKEGGIKKHLVHHSGFTNCALCEFKTLSSKSMGAHLVYHYTNGFNFTCPVCKNSFEKMGYLKAHMLISHRNVDVSVCLLCGLKIECSDKFIHLMQSLRQHIQDKHLNKKEVTYNCPSCDFQTSLDLEMKSHIYLSHSDLKNSIYGCSECPHLTTSLTRLIHHLDIHRANTSKVCNLCKFVSSNDLRMNLHIKTHSEAPFKCVYCNAKFKHNFLIKYHIRSRHSRK